MTILDQLLQLQKHTNHLASIDRSHYLPQITKKENNVEHSFSLSLIAWQLHTEADSKLSLEKILKYCVVHDLVEIYAGDVNTFASAAARQQKELDERRALSRLKREYRHSPEFVAILESCQDHADAEALFTWACDKIQALIQGYLDDWRCYYELGITNDVFREKLEHHISKAPTELSETFQQLGNHFVQSFDYDETFLNNELRQKVIVKPVPGKNT